MVTFIRLFLNADCESTAFMTYHKGDTLAGKFLMILQVAKLGPVSRAAGMDCECPLYIIYCMNCMNCMIEDNRFLLLFAKYDMITVR